MKGIKCAVYLQILFGVVLLAIAILQHQNFIGYDCSLNKMFNTPPMGAVGSCGSLLLFLGVNILLYIRKAEKKPRRSSN